MITLKEIGVEDFDAFEKIAHWSNDPEIRPYFTPRFSKAPYAEIKPHEMMLSLISNPCKHAYLICEGDKAIGEASIDLCFPNKVSHGENIAWIGVVIGEAAYRGKGIGVAVMHSIEETCKKLGAEAIELGVFAYNDRARHLYEKLGYQPIATIENFVYNFGAWHNDIRLFKTLV